MDLEFIVIYSYLSKQVKLISLFSYVDVHKACTFIFYCMACCFPFTKPEIKELCFGYNNCFTLTTRLLNRWPERERPQQEKGKENPQQTIEGVLMLMLMAKQ
ncbi:hypothetical protein T11_15858 [Trichinella zimbabwensis]|uniref:Uncharacterized protein n=1 Tax=Trichinella zimbabwensis TaxID=268475 RepID=A0A0V1GWH5_9BILA|nr:hypothetical protein T11_15858 [Trichinella zimbabwensis]